jgi:hypothetical protein
MAQACAGFGVASGSATFDRVEVAQAPDFYFGDPQPATRTISPASPTATYGLSVVSVNNFGEPLEFSIAGLPAGAKAYFSAPTISGSGGTILQLNAGTAAAGTYTLTISATNGTLRRSATATLIVSSAGSGLPDPWVSRNVGPDYAGTGTTYASGVFTVSGGSGAADSLQFAFQPLIGDAAIVTRLVSVQNPLPAGAAGLMVRESMAQDAAFATVSLPPGGGAFLFQGRNSAGAAATTEQMGASAAPAWLKLVRAGSAFTAFGSLDGVVWNQIGTARTTPMGAVVYAGFAVSSGTAGQVTIAMFDSLGAPAGVLDRIGAAAETWPWIRR